MIGIKLARKFYLKLQRQVGITITMANLFFSEELEYGEMVNTITVSAKQNNALNSKNLHTEDSNLEYPYNDDDTVEVFKDTVKILEGRYEYTQTTEGEIDVDVITGLQGLGFTGRKLSELYAEFETPFICETPEELIAHAKDQNDVGTTPDPKYVFPTMHNAAFYGSANTDFHGILNRWDGTLNKFFVNDHDVSYSSVHNYDALCPQVLIIKALKEIFMYHGDITLAGSFIADTDVSNRMLIYNNRALDNVLKMYALMVSATFPINLGLGGGQCSFGVELFDTFDVHNDVNGEINISRPGLHRFDFVVNTDYTDVTTYIFEIKVAGVVKFTKSIDRTNLLDRIFSVNYIAADSEVGLKFTTHFTKGNGTTLMLDAGSTLDMHISNPGDGYNFYETELKISNHFPDITLGDLINRMKTLGLKFDYNSSKRILNIDYITTELNSYPAQDFSSIGSKRYIKKILGPQIKSVQFEFPDNDELTELITETYDINAFIGEFESHYALPTPTSSDQVALVLNTSQLYKSKIDTVSGLLVWSFYKYYYPRLNYDEKGESDYLIKCTPVLNRYIYNVDTGARMLVPAVKNLGSSPGFNIGLNNNTDVRIFFWREFGADEGLEGYPFASSLCWFTAGGITDPLINVKLEGLQNISSLWWGKWFNMLNIGIVWTRKFYFNILHILKFNPNKSFRFRNHTFLPKNASIEVVSNSKIAEASIDYIEIRP